ncbi:MAG TPA: hypothetical protein VFZ21_04370, partial [Gemmatimonadaceae bacterium]|nr:hypothetical protein [Gemmatimonadaceae bacterium]
APQRGEPTLSEDAAHRLLARAVELDAQHGSRVSVAQLREIAREAGIAPEAFDAALGEYHNRTAEPARRSRVLAPLRRWWPSGQEEGKTNRTDTMWKAVTINVLAFAVFWVVLSSFSRVSAALDLSWPANHAGNILANLFGVGVALRLRARVTGIVLGVTAAAQLAGYIMHLIFGIQSVQGGPTHWALFLAGLLGIALGALLMRSRTTPADVTPTSADEPATATAQSSTRVPDQPPASLRLRAI